MVVAARMPIEEVEAARRVAETRGSTLSREICRAIRGLVAMDGIGA